MIQVMLEDRQSKVLKRLITDKIKEVTAWSAATESNHRDGELSELKQLMKTILNSEWGE